ncbi:hypothetical protein [Actinoplanes sp. OR16]|uniref:hypothetical protein n=1 Tax=Actinoplanes sp. OR16 TaxID=946334 RepID=UPI000FD88F79|nr:hypothetical protein [Actinoplanes sp. OR16]
MSGAAVIVAGGAALAFTQSTNSDQQSLHEPPAPATLASVAASATASEPAAPSIAGSSTASTSTTADPATGTGATGTGAATTGADATKADATDADGNADPGDTAGAGRSETKRNSGDTETYTSEKAEKEIREARRKAAEDGVELHRPLKAKVAAEGPVTEQTKTIKGTTVRVTSARHDLTGTQRLLIAGDEGWGVGNGIHCTNRIRFSQNVPATERPTVLLCWRTSSDRSVITMATDPQGKPSTATSVDLIKDEWAKLS